MPKVSYGRLIRVGLVGPKLRAKAVSDGQLVSIPAPLTGRFKAKGVTQEGRRGVPIGHGASLARRRLERGKSLSRSSGGVGARRRLLSNPSPLSLHWQEKPRC